jgi:predicted metal-dependent hydrolase
MRIDDIEIEVEFKPIKNTHLSVYPPDGRVHVSAPDYLSEEDVHSYVVSKWDWVLKQRREIAEMPRQTEREYVSGENHFLFGSRYRLKVVEITSGQSCIKLQGDIMLMQVRHQANRHTLIQEYYRSQLKDYIAELLEKWSKKLQLCDYTWQVKLMRTQWGSCTKKSRILLFNLELARVPKECIEYVVVHELTHLTVENHGKVFEAMMTARLPRWRSLRSQLNNFIALPMSD